MGDFNKNPPQPWCDFRCSTTTWRVKVLHMKDLQWFVTKTLAAKRDKMWMWWGSLSRKVRLKKTPATKRNWWWNHWHLFFFFCLSFFLEFCFFEMMLEFCWSVFCGRLLTGKIPASQWIWQIFGIRRVLFVSFGQPDFVHSWSQRHWKSNLVLGGSSHFISAS